MIATDGNPSCILEAMACKTPVITANLPELREMFAGDVVLTNVKDAKNLAYKITRVLERRDTVMVERAYKKAQQFSGKNVAQTVLQLYKK